MRKLVDLPCPANAGIHNRGDCSIASDRPDRFASHTAYGPGVRRDDDELRYSAACCATVGAVPATVARRMSRGCDWS